MALTKAEQLELEQLKAERNASASAKPGLTPEEQAELAQLKAEKASTEPMSKEQMKAEVSRKARLREAGYADDPAQSTFDASMANLGAGMMGAGRGLLGSEKLANAVTDGSYGQAYEQNPTATKLGVAAGAIGGAVGASKLLNPANIIGGVGVSNARPILQGATNAAVGSGLISTAENVAEGDLNASNIVADTALGFAGGAVAGKIGQAISAKLASRAAEKAANESKDLASLGAKKIQDIKTAAEKVLGPNSISQLNDDVVQLESGNGLKGSNILGDFWTNVKNKVFDGAKTGADVDANLAKMLPKDSAEMSSIINKLGDESPKDFNVKALLKSEGSDYTPDELWGHFKDFVSGTKMPEKYKGILLNGTDQALDAKTIYKAKKALQDELIKFYKQDGVKRDIGDSMAANVRTGLGNILEDMDASGRLKELNSNIHAALNLRKDLNLKAELNSGLMKNILNRSGNALTRTGQMIAPVRGVIDTLKGGNSVQSLIAPVQQSVTYTRTLEGLKQAVSDPLLMQKIGPDGAALVNKFFSLPKDQQEAKAGDAILALQQKGASFEKPSSGYQSEINGKLTNTVDKLAAAKQLSDRSDLTPKQKALQSNELFKNGTVPASIVEEVMRQPGLTDAQKANTIESIRTTGQTPLQTIAVPSGGNVLLEPSVPVDPDAPKKRASSLLNRKSK